MTAPINLFEYEPLARARIEPVAWGYLCGGAEDEITLRENRAAFERTLIRPRYLVDITERDLATTVLGTKIPFPLMLAPTAYQTLWHPEGECETARGANDTGIPLIVSTLGTRTMEETARAATVPLWFQLYMMEDMDVNEWFLRRAERNNYRAIVLTVDVVASGNRERDRRSGFDVKLIDIRNVTTPTADAPALVTNARHHQDIPWKQKLSWHDVAWLRQKTQLPIVVKGLLTSEDAKLAAEHGAAGIVVSNHGGRQLDGAPAALDALPEIAAAVGAQLEIYLDGGVRRGADILKAVALGARAVCIGRPYLWGLAADGAQGVRRVIEILRYEFDTAMALTGKRAVSELDASVIFQTNRNGTRP